MAAASDVIYMVVVAMETNKTSCVFNKLKVQRKLIICAKYQVNQLNGAKSGEEGSDCLPPPPPALQFMPLCNFLGLCIYMQG